MRNVVRETHGVASEFINLLALVPNPVQLRVEHIERLDFQPASQHIILKVVWHVDVKQFQNNFVTKQIQTTAGSSL